MNTAYSWIKSFVPELDVSAQEYMDAMTLSGTKLEGYTRLDEDLDKIVIGQVKSVSQHPDAEKLVVCKVDIGTEMLQIVTGAPNVFEGAKVAVVVDGGKVAGGHDGKLTKGGIVIKAGKLRGVDSKGMMCSIEEMGSSRDFYPEAPENGIYIFPDDAVIGEDAIKALGLDDIVFEYEVTSNRVDCYSVVGIAREAAATFRKPFVFPPVKETGNDENASDYISVEVKDTDLCRRYCARVVKNVKIGPSPVWMQRRLAASGIRPINNLVDITNYVMEEYGQPMHAYDLDTIAGNKIIVRRANDGEKFVTLDGQTRNLDKDVIMICDAEKPVGIGGIMGGENSMITGNVKTVLFEAATFDGANIRLSAKRIGLRTDASGKFEKGLDPNNAKAAIDRACELMELLGAGEVVGGTVDVYPEKVEESRVKFEPEVINNLLGTELSAKEMLDYLALVELKYDEETNEIVAPTFRQDIHRTADIAEEVARFFGYNNIPTTLPKGEATRGGVPFEVRVEEKVRDVLEYCGFSEGYAYSFESPKVFDKLRMAEDAKERNAIVISNPLGPDFSIMRTVSVNGILTSLASNYNRRNKNVSLYEIGNIYLAKALPLTELPDERKTLTFGFYGDKDFYDMKGVCEEVMEQIGMKQRPEYVQTKEVSFLHPGRAAYLVYAGETIGYFGEVHPETSDAYGIGGRAYIAVLDLSAMYKYCTFDRKFEGIARFPSVSRDISILVPKELPAVQVENMIRQRGGKILESVALFDLYEGEKIEKGFKSMAYSIIFRSKEKTLEESDITGAMKKILNGLEGMNISLRS